MSYRQSLGVQTIYEAFIGKAYFWTWLFFCWLTSRFMHWNSATCAKIGPISTRRVFVLRNSYLYYTLLAYTFSCKFWLLRSFSRMIDFPFSYVFFRERYFEVIIVILFYLLRIYFSRVSHVPSCGAVNRRLCKLKVYKIRLSWSQYELSNFLKHEHRKHTKLMKEKT